MRLHRSEIIMLALTFVFMIAVLVQTNFTKYFSETSHISVEKTAQRGSLLTGGDGTMAKTLPGLIDINTADEKELCKLPGIGEVLALRIIEYREANGAFSNIEDITNVSGIGEKTFEAIKNLIECGESGK